ncbi:MAG: GTPase Era [Nevskiales bacterium]
MDQRCGTIALLGRPNVGKSTLLNALVGEKVSIVTAKPQTTRHSIAGILTRADTQFVFVDLPGVHTRSESALNHHLNKVAAAGISDVDLVLCLVEGGRWQADDERVLELLQRVEVPVGLIVTKIDQVKPREKLLPILKQLSQKHAFAFSVPVAARKGQNLAALLSEIEGRLPVQPFLFAPDQFTDRSERFLVAEAVREKLMQLLQQELPYRVSVEVEKFEESGKQTQIHVMIWVDRESQKAIVIGEGGATLKRVGQQARLELQERLGRRIHLQLWVKVKAGWADDERALRALGYE